MQGPSLAAIFQDDRDWLRCELAGCDPAGALRSIRRYLDGLPDQYRAVREEARAPLSDSEEGRTDDIVEAIRAGFSSIEALRRPRTAAAHDDRVRRDSSRNSGGTLTRLLKVFLGEPRPTSSPKTGPGRNGRAAEGIEVDAERLLDSLCSALEAAERAVDDGDLESPQTLDWADDAELVGVFHDLLSAGLRRDGREILMRLEYLEDALKLRHGIRTVSFDGDNEAFFEFLPDPDPTATGFTTRRPALVGERGLIKRGEVRGPADRVSAELSADAKGTA
jgi:hypothetical protein